MNYVWNVDGVKIGSISTNRWAGTILWTSGYALQNDEAIQWEVCATPTGYYVVITRSTGKIEEFQGSTFNLPLEVAAAIHRLV